MRSTLLHDKVNKWARAKVHVYSDSVLCLGKMDEHTDANAKWKDQLPDFQQPYAYGESFVIDGEPIEFEWNICPDRQRWRFFNRFKTNWECVKQVQKKLKIESSSCATTLIGQRKEIPADCFSTSEKVKTHAGRFPARTLVIPRSRRRRKMVWTAHLHTRRTVE